MDKAQQNTDQKDSYEFKETNDCTVKALSLCTGIGYRKAHALMAEQGRKKRKGAHIGQWREAFSKAGFHLYHETDITSLTMRTVMDQLEDSKIYLVHSTQHVAAVVKGDVLDWSKGRMKKIRAVYQVLPYGERHGKVPAKIQAKRVKPIVKRPKVGKCADMWAMLDRTFPTLIVECSLEDHYMFMDIIDRRDALDMLEGNGYIRSSASAELTMWMRFNKILKL